MSQHTTTPIWVGMDVHRRSVTAAILHGNQQTHEVVAGTGDGDHPVDGFDRLRLAPLAPMAATSDHGPADEMHRTDRLSGR